MVVRYRLRAILIPLLLYAVSGGVAYYFMYHAQHGNRGIETKAALKQQIFELERDLGELRSDREDWERRVAMLRTDNVDRDLLDERARLTLNRLHRNDVVIMTGPGAN
ncbi:septum formation initiator family protein [uncultured Alsobacter sp.]|uniref:FtsB family cell division protein n=1 Tax=uncultured Alsobacter sp. TaxID=1748258 RepID=UPI0025D0F643|nr:septum formation initiator family protein [uncultured Alsobacter sp.]